jgi:carbamoyl-phosphate synthase large subunit
VPKRTDIKKIMIIGSGPIVIGQACEFDYSGTQATKALRQEGYEVVLINSNPATIMTDPEMSDRVYIEPLVPSIVAKIVERERPDAMLSTVGGQTGLNLAVDLAEMGVLDRCGVELLGAELETIKLAEDRLLFREAVVRAGLEVPRSDLASNVEEALQLAEELGYPIITRPSFTLGGAGGGIAYSRDDLIALVKRGLRESPVHQILVEESVLGWKEYELEIMQDKANNFVVICSIENFDPMGVHTGDSITVAPAQTLTDKEYQRLRDQAKVITKHMAIKTGGANIQFAVNPADGRVLVIEMNPRVSRSSALASKATGFPIAKLAALLAVGYTLDEIPNDITQKTPASFEPTIDYVVVKIPRWAFEKFPNVDQTLNTQMKSVGEAMAIGRTFKEALQKGLRSLENGYTGLDADRFADAPPEVIEEKLAVPNEHRLFYITAALQQGSTIDEVHRITGIDPWFLHQIQDILDMEGALVQHRLDTVPADLLRQAKRYGFSDAQLARLLQGIQPNGAHEREAIVCARRQELGITPVFQRVDTCAAEFEAFTPYLYSTYETECEASPSDRRKVMILGSGPNRIGQGVEFDYCCCHAAFALRDMGFETIMVNCNPETVSTDYDTSDRLYFEPLTFEDVSHIIEREKPDGIIVQFGGQTPLNLARRLQKAGYPIWGTSPEDIDAAEDRGRFGALMNELGIPQPENDTASSLEEARAVAEQIGYPVLVRPSYVLGGRAMAIVYDESSLATYVKEAVKIAPEHPILIDRYLEDAYELDVDAVADGEQVVIGGIMHHIESAGIHSGDSACVIPPYKVSRFHQDIIREYTHQLGLALNAKGLLNIQFAIKDDIVYVLEVNPRASRTAPFVSKATGVPLAKIAAMVMAGKTLEELGFTREPIVSDYFVKEAVLPFQKLHGSDAILGPEMKSTGEVMGVSRNFGHAFAKAELGAGTSLPLSGTVLLSVNDHDKTNIVKIAVDLTALGFSLAATTGTARVLSEAGLNVQTVCKVSEGTPNVVALIHSGEIDLIINTPLGKNAFSDGMGIRQAAVVRGVSLITTLSGAAAAVAGIEAMRREQLSVQSLQEHYASLREDLRAIGSWLGRVS